ncbi:MAG: putative rane protein [Herbinix sp.]|jgi:putative flippase GtrA|nr:putative rane protein [Herbinix sp.]
MILDEKNSLVKRVLDKLINRETITYMIAGGLTTAVNFISYESLYQIGLPNLTANAWAWVIAVTFAYIVNKISVFRAKSSGILEELLNIAKFFAARLITLGIEQSGMYYFVEQLGLHRLMVKASLAVIVIVLNYIFSKVFIFGKLQDKK